MECLNHTPQGAPLPLALVFLTCLAAAVFLWGWFSSNLVLKNNPYPISILPRTFGLDFEDAAFKTEDGLALSAWFVPAKKPSDKTIIVCHGWGANRSDVVPTTFFLNSEGGYNLFYFDFRNHGESAGKMTSLISLEARDLEAAVAYLKSQKPAQARVIAFYGMSMGGAVAITVGARNKEIAGVVAESPYASLDETVVRFGRLFYNTPRYPLVPITLLFLRWRLGFDPNPDSPVNHAGEISPRPLLLIQGDKDLRMPVAEGEALFAAAKEPKELWTVPGADHGEVAEKAGPDYQKRLLAFYEKAFHEK
jgi:pimeloyl-ACP methyl ester carboxylesterase